MLTNTGKEHSNLWRTCKGGSTHSPDGQMPSGQLAPFKQKAPGLVPGESNYLQKHPTPQPDSSVFILCLIGYESQRLVMNLMHWMMPTHSVPGSSLHLCVTWYFWPYCQVWQGVSRTPYPMGGAGDVGNILLWREDMFQWIKTKVFWAHVSESCSAILGPPRKTELYCFHDPISTLSVTHTCFSK